MQKIRRISAIALLVLVCGSGTGCVALALAGVAGAASLGAAFYMGEYEGYLAANPPQITDAAGDVLRNMNVNIVFEGSSWDHGKLEGTLASKDEIVIKVKKKSEQMSQISVRIGVFGNERLSASIYNQIKARLKAE